MRASTPDLTSVMGELCVKNTFYNLAPEPETTNLRRTKSESDLPKETILDKEENQENFEKFQKLSTELNNQEPRISFEQFLAEHLKANQCFDISQYNFLEKVKNFLPKNLNNRDVIIGQVLESYESLKSIIKFQKKLQTDLEFKKLLPEFNKEHSSDELLQYSTALEKFLKKNQILQFNEAHIEIAIFITEQKKQEEIHQKLEELINKLNPTDGSQISFEQYLAEEFKKNPNNFDFSQFEFLKCDASKFGLNQEKIDSAIASLDQMKKLYDFLNQNKGKTITREQLEEYTIPKTCYTALEEHLRFPTLTTIPKQVAESLLKPQIQEAR